MLGDSLDVFITQPMNLIGIPLRRPTFGELTAAAVMATGLWLAALGLTRVLHLPMDRIEAGALLLVVVWGCISARLGIRIGMGHRHLLANLAVSALLLGAYQGAWALAA
jgi:hypothetical protein